ncbi:MAG TPA: hypothetical protein PLV53_01010 [Anaerolineaceae bacterium]|nr:hypothetical protein [Anaerolineaceae bacterium]
MKASTWRAIAGIILILMGLLSLLYVMNFDNVAEFGWGMLFGAGAVAFLAVFLSAPRPNWWAVIPGFALLGIAFMLVLEALNLDALGELIGGSVFLGLLGLAFWIIYLLHRDYWWAIIPGGVLTSLAIVNFLDELIRFDLGWLFLLGLSATFGLVYLLGRHEGRRMEWPLWPAGILAVIALLSLVEASNLAGFVWPLALILAGLYLIWRSLRGKPVF